MDIDDVYVRTGEFGKFQWRAFAACCLYSLFAGTQMVQNIFAGAIPESLTCEDHNLDACDPKCPHVECDFKSYAIEWNMTCGAGVTSMQSIQSIFMAGVMVGSFFMGGLGDKYGRFPVFMIAHIACSLFGFISSFAHSWAFYACLRFFTGFFLSGIMIIGFVLTSELVGPSKRGIVGTVPAGVFAVGVSLLSLTAWFTQEWRTMSILLGLLGILLTPVMYCWYEESPRWYLGQGNVTMCQSILKKIAKINGHDLGDISLKVSNAGDEEAETSMLSLFKNEILLKITLVQFLSWFSNSAVYYGLTIASGDMGNNRYISVVLSAIVEVPSNLIILSIMNIPKCGRVRSCVVGMLVSSLFCASIWFIDEGHKTAVILSACLGKFFIVSSFAIIYVQAAELYPTPVRNVGIGLLSVSSRIGGIMAPQIVNLNNLYHNSHFIIFGILGCVSGVLCLLLPETLGRPLPESPEDLFGVKKVDKEVVAMRIGDREQLLSTQSHSLST